MKASISAERMAMKFLKKFFKADEGESCTNCNTSEPKCPAIFPLWDLLHQNGQYYASMSMAYNLYETTAALGDAVDMIAKQTKAINPYVFDENWDMIEGHPLLQFLKKPNRNQNWREFIFECAINKLVSNNLFLILIGNANYEPLEIYTIKSSYLTSVGLDKNSQPIYQISASNFYRIFNGLYNYNSKSNAFLNTNYKELVHLKGYCKNGSEEIFALPIMNSVLKEIEITNGSSVHNASLLRNGVTLSGIFRLATTDRKAIEEFRDQVREYFTGNTNAGKFIAAHADNIDFKPVNATNKDMQILELKEDAANAIYDKYGIPKPLRDPNTQTYDNYSVAKTSLYDDAILPLIEDIFAKLQEVFVRRKLLKANEYLSYSANDIPALQQRTATWAKDLSQVGVLTDNEIRAELGFDPYDGGDIVYKQVNMAPVNDPNKPFPNNSSDSQQNSEENSEKV